LVAVTVLSLERDVGDYLRSHARQPQTLVVGKGPPICRPNRLGLRNQVAYKLVSGHGFLL